MARRQQRHDDEHMDESWLIPYADILTLLLALFIVLYAAAEINQSKVQEIAKSFNNAFKGSNSVFESTRTDPSIIKDTPRLNSVETQAILSNMANQSPGYVQESIQLLEAKQIVDKYIDNKGLGGDYDTIITDDGLLIRIKDSAFFESGRAELLLPAKQFGEEIAKMLVPLPQKVHISGHTDSIPINTYEFPTNWDLSSKRALNFMKYILSSQVQLKPERFSATGYGEYHPIATNATEVGRSNNRRVEVLIMRSVTKTQNKL